MQLKHKSQPASGQVAKPATEPVAGPAAEPAALSQQKRKPARRSTRGRGDSASAKILAPAPVQQAAQLLHVPPKPVDSDDTINFAIFAHAQLHIVEMRETYSVKRD